MKTNIYGDKTTVHYEYRRVESPGGSYWHHRIILWTCREVNYTGKVEFLWDRLFDIRFQANAETSNVWYAPEIEMGGSRGASLNQPEHLKVATAVMIRLSRHCARNEVDRRGIVEWLHKNKIARVFYRGGQPSKYRTAA